jgi:hypothetical protein
MENLEPFKKKEKCFEKSKKKYKFATSVCGLERVL